MKYRSNHNKFLLTACGLILVAVIVWLGWYKFIDTKSVKLPSNVATSASASDNNLNNQRKASSSPAQTLDNGSTSTSSTTNSNSTPISLTITRAGVVDNSLQVGTLVTGTTTGTCTLSVSQTGQVTITKTNQVTQENNSYVCPVFSVSTSNFPNQGSWNVSVSFSSANQTTTSNWADNPVNLSSSQ